jgi:hypothetical protein
MGRVWGLLLRTLMGSGHFATFDEGRQDTAQVGFVEDQQLQLVTQDHDFQIFFVIGHSTDTDQLDER